MTIKRTIALPLAALLLWVGMAACSRPHVAGPTGEEDGPGPAAPLPSEREAPQVPDGPHAAPPDEAVQAVPPLSQLANMMETIEALCGEPRPLGSEAEHRAALFLRDRLEEYGYAGELETFSYNLSATTLSQRYRQARELTGEAFLRAALPGEQRDGDSQNVIGTPPDEDDRKPVLVLSAHYDSTPDSIGAVDNASGVAVVLEAARILAGEELPFSLRIVFFGGEEAILIGSRQYVLGLSPEERERILGNISVDTLAYSAAEEFVALTPLLLSVEDGEALAAASPAAAALLADDRVSPAFRSQLVGDHLAFFAAGIDSVNFGQSMDQVNGVINSPLDTPDLLVPQLLPVAAELLADAVRELAAEALRAQETAVDRYRRQIDEIRKQMEELEEQRERLLQDGAIP